MLSSCDIKIGTGLGLEAQERIVDHAAANIEGLTDTRTALVKSTLNIAYWHTSHGSQLVDGMSTMDAFHGGTGRFEFGGSSGLQLADDDGQDLGNPTRDAFEATTRSYLAAHSGINVVIWSWCGQASAASTVDIDNYLSRMSHLERDFPGVVFVYMTGHADGSGPGDNLAARNAQIRAWCKSGGRWLFDFNDIESWDPDGKYYGDKYVTDGCEWDSDGDGNPYGDRNWASEWQAAHPGQWWDCDSQHSLPLNANRKAMAAWQLWVRIAESMRH